MKVLIADDSLISRSLLRRSLSSWQYEVVEACDGADAWEILQRDDGPRIAILDWYMPVMTGAMICQKLRERTTEPYVYAILLTAKDDRDNLIRGLEAGADDFLGKPFDPEELKQRLQAGARIIDLEDQLRVTQKDLQERNQELDEFADVASHDLQEPLRKLISFSQLLVQDLGDAINEQAQRDVDYIVESADRMRTLIQNLLALSKTGRSAMKRDLVNLNDCVSKALNSLQIRIDESGGKIVCDELPEVVGDEIMLTQLYQNLIGNALKFVANRQPLIQLTCEPNGSSWILGVKDNGIGMKAEHVERVFQPFQRLHARGEYEGTGIGLAICKKAVQRHGGQIWVESQPGEGSCFKFTMEVHQPQTTTASPVRNIGLQTASQT